MGIKAVAFDIDGTLYNIKHLNKQFTKAFLRHPFRTRLFFVARKNVRKLLENRNENILSRDVFLHLQTESVGKKDGYFDVVYKILRKNRKLPPFKEVDTFLSLLHSKGIICATLSDFPLETKLDELGLKNYFDITLSAEDCGFLKPNKKAFDYLLNALKVEPSECLYIGDSLTKDKNGAINSGMKALLLGEDFTSYGELVEKINILLK